MNEIKKTVEQGIEHLNKLIEKNDKDETFDRALRCGLEIGRDWLKLTLERIKDYEKQASIESTRKKSL